MNYDAEYLPKAINDSSLYRSGNIENSEHYLLQCKYYQKQRNEMNLLDLCDASVYVLLFGDMKTMQIYSI